MSDHRISGQQTWTLRAKRETTTSTKAKAPVQWTRETRGWAPTAWRRPA